MVFSSLTFIFLFLPLVLIIYFSAPRKWKNAILFVLSLLFYAWGEPIYIFLLVFSTIIDFCIGLYIDKHRDTYKAKLGLITSIVISILVLSVFKYSGFIVQNINNLFGTTFINPDLPLPVGISFYTFQTMSYIIDVYRGNVKVQRNIISFGAYVSMFPQLVAGPIVRYATIEEQLRNRVHSVDLFAEGVQRFSIGLAKKVLLANNIGYIWAEIEATNGSEMSIALAWLGIIAFAFQIYFDFSGYSDMAIGLGLMLGFRFLENFNYPYISRSITEFWRRWHISLGSWFREYVYIPLGGNKKGLPKQLVNLLIVWSLTGIWHGASWNFVIWGALNGAGMIVYKVWAKMNWNIKMLLMTLLMGSLWVAYTLLSAPIWNLFFVWGIALWIGTFVRYIYWWIERIGHFAISGTPRAKIIGWISGGWAVVQTFVFITFTRLFFRSGSNLDPATASQEAWETATNMVNQIGGAWNSSIIPDFLWEYRYVVILFVLGMVVHWLPNRVKRWYRIRFCQLPIWAIILIAVVAIIGVYQFVTADLQAFIYFQF